MVVVVGQRLLLSLDHLRLLPDHGRLLLHGSLDGGYIACG